MIDLFLDCDNTFGNSRAEIDDGLLILYLLGEPRVRLHGVSLTFGNGPLEEVVQATRGLLERVRRPDLPLYVGAATPGQWESDAARAIADAASGVDSLRLLATGPLTNVAGAAVVEPRFWDMIGSVAAMGGVQGPLLYPKRRGRELNLSADAEAARRVLDGPRGVCLFPAETCLEAKFGFGSLLRTLSWPRWARETTWSWFRHFSAKYGTRGFYLWDLLPALWIVEPELFETELVELQGEAPPPGLEEGRLNLQPSDGGKLRVARHIRNVGTLKKRLFEAWDRALS